MVCVVGIAEHLQQSTRPIFLHLHRYPDDVQCTLIKKTINYVTKHLWVQIVKIGFQDCDCLFRDLGHDLGLTNREAGHVCMPTKIPRARSVPDFVYRHPGKWFKSRSESLHDGGARRCYQFEVEAG